MSRTSNVNSRPPIPLTEWAMLQVAAEIPATTVWTTTIGRGQLAREYARLHPESKVICHSLDLYKADSIAIEAQNEEVGNLEVSCQPDWPAGKCQMALLPFDGSGEESLACDLIQGAYAGLEIGGKLLISGEQHSEAWIRKQLRPLNKSIKVVEFKKAVVASIEKTAELKSLKNFWADVVFRDQGRLIKVQTRPGVFAHRKLDVGARQLLNHIELNDDERRILDIGCGSGAVGLGLSLRAPGRHVVAIDSNPRAVDCTSRNFSANQAGTWEVILNHRGDLKLSEPVDLVVANPPYFSNFRIAEIFCELAAKNVRADGRVFFVAKNVDWYRENFNRWFSNVEYEPASGYWVVSATGQS